MLEAKRNDGAAVAYEDSLHYAFNYFEQLKATMEAIDLRDLPMIVQTLLELRRSGKTLYIIGNGGSAATANHYANDFSFITKSMKSPLRAVSLSANTSVLTMIANDYEYSEIFRLQLKCYLQKGDAVMAISASGNSPNILKAVEYAQEMNVTTIGLTGFDGGELKKMCQLRLHVPTEKGNYGQVEDLHLIFDHLLTSYLRRMLLKEEEENAARN